MYTAPVGEETYTEIMQVEKLPVNLNYWQYFSSTFFAENDYESIDLIFNQSRSANNFYITDLCLYKDISSEHYSYDESGNLISIGNSNDDVENFKYNSNNQLIKSTSAKGANFRFEYDNEHSDRMLSAISAKGISNQLKYDSYGNPICTRISKRANEELINGLYKIRSKGTNKYLTAKNSKHLLMEINSCSNPIWLLEKVDNNFKIKLSDMDNYELSYCNNIVFLGVNNLNNLFCLEENDNGSYYIKQENTDSYLKVCEDNSLIFDDLKLDDSSFEFYFESLEDIFIETTSTYSTDGRFVTSVTDSNFNTTYYETDATTGLIQSMTDANNQTTNYQYNEKQQLTSMTTGNKTVNYVYNENNLLSKIIQDTKEYNLVYDNFLNLNKVMIGEQITLITNEYEERNGNLYKTIYGNNQELIFDYDSFDRIKTLHKMDDNYHYKYDNNGNIAKILSNNHEEKFVYDIKKRLKEYRFDNFKIKYDYDSNDNIVNKKYKLNNDIFSIANTYDADDLLQKMAFYNNEINYQYDSLGRIINKKINNNFITQYEYVSSGKRTSDLIDTIRIGNNNYNYKYDKLNNITDVYNNNNLIKKYYYDEINELIKEEDFLKNERIVYSYDNCGNILSKVISNIEDNSIIKSDIYTYSNNVWKDQLTKFNNELIVYDTIGNPLTIGNNISLSWINGNDLNSYYDAVQELNVTYKYNRDGIRISKIVNNIETNYFLDGNKVVYEKTGDNIIKYLYDSTGVVGLVYNNIVYYYVKNLNGDIIGILNSTNEQVVQYEYDSWGNILKIADNDGNVITDSNNIGIINPFRYRGYYYDSETNLYYLGTRYYNSVWGRFINQDVTIGEIGGNILGHNMYQYAFNNPINFSDQDGAWPKWAKKALAAVAIVAVVAVVAAVTVATCGAGSVAATIAVGAAKGAAVGAITSAAIAGTSGAISHRVKTGSWKGSGKAALNSASDAAVKGAVSGAILGGASSTVKVLKTASSWDKGTFKTKTGSLSYHYNKHVIKEGGYASNIFEYTDDALNWADQNKDMLKYTYNYKYGNASWNFKYIPGSGGEYTSGGKIIAFWYKSK